MIVELVLTVVGIVILIISIGLLIQTRRIIKANTYSTLKWDIVLLLLFFFVLGYGYNTLTLMNERYNVINPAIMVSLVYLFGAVFTVITMSSVYHFVREVLGSFISDEEAIKVFKDFAGYDKDTPFLRQKFVVECDKCHQKIQYSVASVIRQHLGVIDRGVQIVEVFGTKSFLFSPIHKCIDGRRMIPVVHDDNLELRSVESSRLMFKSVV